ncbi:MAG: hypothetical protein KF845_02290 [Cyclobacteriaceae bacterium]|nr:hypothetical protein [Cyclobacteriaceae bacterium]
MISTLSSEAIQQYILDHEGDDEQKLALGKKDISGVPPAVIAGQIKGKRKAKEKLPRWYNTPGIVYPPSINLEQCSSQATAQFKAELIQKTLIKNLSACADLTGGFGVDSFFFSTVCREVHYIEPHHELLTLTKHNHERLGAGNIFHYNTTAEIFLQRSAEKFDFIYIDPSRRNKANKKVFKFSECEPDVTKLTAQLFEKTNYLLVKASPLIDIQQGLLGLPRVRAVYVVSVDSECKEVLFLCEASFNDEPVIHAVNIVSNSVQQFSFKRADEKNTEATFSEPLTYLYEPNASLLKAGAFKIICETFCVDKLHTNTHLYTSHELKPDFPGRVFKIISTIKPNPKEATQFFPDRKANVITRNYPLMAEALKKKMKLNDGGERYLLAFSSLKGKEVVVADGVG